MKKWLELCAEISFAKDEQKVVSLAQPLALSLGFDKFTFALTMPEPLDEPEFKIFSVGDAVHPEWYLRHSTVKGRNLNPIYTAIEYELIGINRADERFKIKQHDAFWDFADMYKMKHGWSAATTGSQGLGKGMVNFLRDHKPLDNAEIRQIRPQMLSLGMTVHNKIMSLQVAGVKEKYSLSPKEINVMRLAADGHSAKDSAAIMNVTERTVIFHRSNCITKTDSENLLQAVVKAISWGLLRL
jgi:DNA-binding CsgD family transcriptional regulator